MDRIKKNLLKDLRFYGNNAMRYKRTGYPEDANNQFIKYNVLIQVLRAR